MIGTYQITVDGRDVSDVIFGARGSSLVYRDNMGLVSDTMDITLIDSNLDMDELFPAGAQIEGEFTTEKGRTLKTGALFIDTEDGKIGGGENTVTKGANSQPEKRPSMKQYIAYSKKRVKLKVFLESILKKSDLNLVYRFIQDTGQLWDVKLRNVVIQSEQLGPVLTQYAELFGCYLKIYNDRVVFVNKQSFNSDPVLKTINPSETSIRDFAYDVNEHQFEEYAISYYNPRTGKTTSDKKSKKSVLVTDSETIRWIIESVADPTAARALAMAVDGQRQASVSFETEGDETAIAGAVWRLNELKKLTGKYVITSAEHTITDNWTVRVTAENIF